MRQAVWMPRLFWALIIIFAVLFLPKLVIGDSSLYTEVLTVRRLLTFAAPAKLLVLVLAAVFAWQSASALGSGNPAALPWRIFSIGSALLAVGQGSLMVYQVVLATSTPFPSVADPPFVVGTIGLVVAAALFVRTYLRSGLALGDRRELVVTLAIGAAIPAVVTIVVLRPINAAGGPFFEWALNLGYPTLDLFLLMPATILLRMMLKMRGGQLWVVWARLLGAFVFMSVGDILYAYFTTLDFSTLDPLLDLSFAYAYILLAWGSYTQRELLTG